VTYDEDRCQVRTGTGPLEPWPPGAASQSAILRITGITGITGIAQALRHHAWDPLQPFALLLIG
jgi:hypothetical protein